MEKEIIENYLAGKTCQEIAKIFSTTRNKISKIIKNKGIKIKGRKGYHKFSFNENYFDKIQNEHEAYWLGWLFSDGYNQRNKNTIKLQIQKRDQSILELLKKDLDYNGPIRDAGYGSQSLIFLTSMNFSEKLAQLGCVQNKSMVLKWPIELPSRLEKHFIRGYFDGDGCISGVNNNFSLTIISTENFCNTLNQKLAKVVGLKNLENHPNNPITKRYRFSGKKQIKKMYEYLYSDSSICLERKKKKMEELLCIS